jgi:hypothetical protein
MIEMAAVTRMQIAIGVPDLESARAVSGLIGNRAMGFALASRVPWFCSSLGVSLGTFVFKRSQGSGRELLSFRCPHGLLIDVYAKTGAFRKRNVPINRLEHIRT